MTRPTNSYCDNKTYNGKSQTYTNSAPTGIKFTNTSGTNAGNYTVTSNPKVNEYYVWNDSTHSNLKSENATFVCKISKKDTAISWGGTTFTYNGKDQGPTASATGVNGETIKITTSPTGKNVGTYTSTAKCESVTGGQKLCSNYNFTGTTKQFTIGRASAGNPPGSPSAKTYNGNNQGSGISCPSGTTAGGTTSAKDAGTYTQTCTPDSNHKWADGSTGAKEISWTINKANATNPSLTAYTGTYDGKSHTITVSGGSGGTIQYSTDNKTWSTTKPSRTDAGTTTVYVRVAGDANHNTTSSVNAKITINKANASCTISSTPTLHHLGTTTGTIEFSCTGDGTLSVTSSNTGVIEVSGTSSTSRTLTAKATGSSTITVSRAASTNYNAASKTATITVTEAIIPTFTINDTVQNKTNKTTAYIRARCKASDGVKTFSDNGTALTNEENDNTSFLAFVKLNPISGKVKLSCTSNSGGVATKNITYTWSRNSDCGVDSTSTTYSGYCQCYFTGGSTITACSKYSLGSNSACARKCQSVYGSNYLRYSGSCSSSTSTTYKTCWHN